MSMMAMMLLDCRGHRDFEKPPPKRSGQVHAKLLV